MEIVKEVRKEKFRNPRVQLLYSMPKAGKTSIVSHLPNHLIVELEPGGADYVEGRVQEIYKASEFNLFLKALENYPDKVCDYLIIDTITKLDEWSEFVGTYNFMQKEQGKKFNRIEVDGVLKTLSPTDVRYETVHNMGQGYGYQHSRNVMVDWYDRILNLIGLGKVTYIILLAHVKDKLIESRNGDSVEAIDLNLTGKVKSIYAARVDAIGHLYREGNKAYLSYDNEYKVVCGGRCSHLEGSILISEKQEDKSIKTFWENIYLK